MAHAKKRRILDLVLGLIFCVILLFPLYWMVNVSLTKPQHLLASPPHFFPSDPTFDGYVRAFSTQLPSLLTSVIISLCSVVVTLIVSAPAAYAMTKIKVRGSGLVMFLLLMAQMIPGIVTVMALYSMYSAVGLLNTYPGLILADATASIPLAVILLRAYMISIPDSLLEAAEIDGAGEARKFFQIVLPLSRNSLVTAALFAFLFSWGDFLNARSLTTGNSIVPFTLVLYRFIGSQTTDWNSVMAAAVIASIPAAFLLVFAQKYVSAGVTAGAVKD